MKSDMRFATADPYSIALSRHTREGTEVYQIAVLGKPAGHLVKYAHGIEGSKLKTATVTPSPLSLDDAFTLYNKLVQAKIAEGYSAVGARAEAMKPNRVPSGAATNRFLISSGRGRKVDRGVDHAKIVFKQENELRLVGLEIASKEHGDEAAQMIVHLQDFPVHGIDVHTAPFRIRLDKASHFASALGRTWVTNLYYFEHTPTEDNRIDIVPIEKGRYRVKWAAQGESMSDHFVIDCEATRVRRIRYP